jgi:hypothetical protein
MEIISDAHIHMPDADTKNSVKEHPSGASWRVMRFIADILASISKGQKYNNKTSKRTAIRWIQRQIAILVIYTTRAAFQHL